MTARSFQRQLEVVRALNGFGPDLRSLIVYYRSSEGSNYPKTPVRDDECHELGYQLSLLTQAFLLQAPCAFPYKGGVRCII